MPTGEILVGFFLFGERRGRARKGAEGRAGVRAAAGGGGENRAKKFFFEGAFCGVYIEMTQ